MKVTLRCRLMGHRLDPEASYYYAIDHCTRCDCEVQIGMLKVERIKVRIAIEWQFAKEWVSSFLARFRPCPECGKKWGRHDATIDHLPF